MLKGMSAKPQRLAPSPACTPESAGLRAVGVGLIASGSLTYQRSGLNTRYLIAPGIDSEELLADACETLTSAKTMATDFAGLVDGSQRHVPLGIAQLIMLGELAVNRALDNLDLKAEAPL
ncbi:DUF6124 family protein [Pseudomonas sp. BW7P1]|nr:DUF6124 family protein [Pseudomonas sp. BW7P1]UWI64447.1 DUF6124 family protein [Pseudomonas sp. BW7P1]